MAGGQGAAGADRGLRGPASLIVGARADIAAGRHDPLAYDQQC
ncbi:hypothetical protein ACFV29_40420 [Streptomyces sp. NPDC059690]